MDPSACHQVLITNIASARGCSVRGGRCRRRTGTRHARLERLPRARSCSVPFPLTTIASALVPPQDYPPAARGEVVVWGLLASYPFGGMTWQVLHHLAGLRRL